MSPPFNPDTAPKVQMTPQERGAVNVQLNNVIVKLGQAGVKLHGNFKFRIVGEPYSNPIGFDFHCDDWKRLHDVASKSSRLGFDPVDMPLEYYDPWRRAGVKAAGFTQKGKPPIVHLDIAIDQPGLCRVYVIPHGQERKIDNLKRSKLVTAKDTAVYKEIYKRMDAIGLDLDLHIASGLTAGRSRLDGINFVAKDHEALIKALTDLKYSGADPIFAPGSKNSVGHAPLALSYMATEGIGFRQIWRPSVSDRPIQAVNPRTGPAMDPRFSANFGDSYNLPDLSSLHCAVSKRICNVHIDEMGFVMVGADGKVIVDPDALRHILVELLWKTNLQGKLPFWALDRVNFDVPSSMNNFSRLGLGIDFVQSKRIKATLRGTCAVDGSMECSGTVNLGIRF